MTPGYIKARDFAALCGTTRDTLLWYDKNGILKPAMIGENGYRLYLPEQAFLFYLISILKRTGNSLKEIQTILRGQDLDSLRTMLAEKKALLTQWKAELGRMSRLLDDISACVDRAADAPCFVPELVTLPAQLLAVTALAGPEDLGPYNLHLRAYGEHSGVVPYPLGSILSGEALLRGQLRVNYVFFPAVTPGPGETLLRPAGSYVRILHKGRYEALPETLELALRFIQAKGLCLGDNVYEYELLTFLLKESEEDYVSEYLLPVCAASN